MRRLGHQLSEPLLAVCGLANIGDADILQASAHQRAHRQLIVDHEGLDCGSCRHQLAFALLCCTHIDDRFPNPRERGLNFNRAQFESHARHAVNNAGRFVLPDGACSSSAHRQQTRGAVAPHSSQYGSHGGSPALCDRVEQHIDARTVTADGIARAQFALQIAAHIVDFQMAFAPGAR